MGQEYGLEWNMIEEERGCEVTNMFTTCEKTGHVFLTCPIDLIKIKGLARLGRSHSVPCVRNTPDVSIHFLSIRRDL